ncbi:hypothetical protein [Photobacterium minamisatsumaniensis]|uniref:hypothetical protein n=1 Tax=Photobacterium minamisatsumaniensis TaxID=2910233 RepID=UPI003D11BF17
MAWETGTANGHRDLLAKLAVFAVAQGWVAVKSLTPTDGEYELWLKSGGESGKETIFVGFRTESDPDNDRFNVALRCSPMFSDGALFHEMPNSSSTKYVYLWKNTIPYYFVVNKDRIIVIAQISTKTHACYLGKLRQYCSLGHWPRQVVVFGESDIATGRWSNEGGDYSIFQNIIPRANAVLWVDNTYLNVTKSYPRQGGFPALDGKPINNSNDRWMIQMFAIHNDHGALGEFQGCFYLSGRDVATWQRLTSPDNSREYVVLQNIYRAGFIDYMAVELA